MSPPGSKFSKRTSGKSGEYPDNSDFLSFDDLLALNNASKCHFFVLLRKCETARGSSRSIFGIMAIQASVARCREPLTRPRTSPSRLRDFTISTNSRACFVKAPIARRISIASTAYSPCFSAFLLPRKEPRQPPHASCRSPRPRLFRLFRLARPQRPVVDPDDGGRASFLCRAADAGFFQIRRQVDLPPGAAQN